MADAGASVEAQCHALLQEIRALRERENAVLETLVTMMAGLSRGNADAGKALTHNETAEHEKVETVAVSTVAIETMPTPTPTPTEALLFEAYGIVGKNPRERLPSSIWDRVNMCIVSDATHHTTLLSVKPDQLNDILGELPVDAPHKTLTSGRDWKYWKVLSRLDDYLWASPGHFPNYMPAWQLRKHEDQWYHIDDTAFDSPFPEPCPTDEVSVQILVPYSLVPPTVRWTAPPDAGSGIPEALWESVYRSLGTLFCVPPDARLQLTFEAEGLRQMHASDKHYRYLDQAFEFQKLLNRNGGELRVCDFSDVSAGSSNASASYGFQAMTAAEKKAWKRAPAHRKAAWPALNKEAGGFLVAPTPVGLYKNVHGHWKAKSYPRSEMPPRPWHRIISLRGLSDIIGPDGRVEQVEALADLLINDADRAKQTMIKSMFNSHVFCRRYKSSSSMFSSPWATLNMTWHRIVNSSGSVDSKTSSWKSGPLHNNELQHIEQRAFTVLYLPHDTVMISERRDAVPPPRDDPADKFWTILVLAPGSSRWVDHYIPPRYSIAIVHIITHGLKEAADAWDQIHPQFSSLIAESSPILDPRRHDRLMFDDDTFSRSRQYFWAMNSLEIFKTQIEDTILEWTHFWTATGSTIKSLAHDEGADEDLESLLRKVNEHVGRLEERKAQFEAIIARTLTLRDGLFNASAVIESKTSTNLGENIQLLTYVSIFYLPLSFCVSMWSVNESYSRLSLVVVALLVAVTTYLLVANLKNVARLFAFTYSKLRDRIIGSMQKDESWAAMAKKFNGFRPRRESDRPSEWNLLRFVVLRASTRSWPFVQNLPSKLVNIPRAFSERGFPQRRLFRRGLFRRGEKDIQHSEPSV